MRSLRKFLYVFVLILIPLLTFSQSDSTNNKSSKKSKPPFSDRIFVGGNLALSFYNGYSIIGASPLVGYKITDKWLAGIGGSYYYLHDPVYGSDHLIGATIFSRYIIFRGVFLEGDFEENNLTAFTIVDPINQTYTYERRWIPSLLLGAGYSSEIGDKSAFYISILYDVIQDPNSPYYGYPVIRGGIGLGL